MFRTRNHRSVLLWSGGILLALAVVAAGQTAGQHRGLFLGLGNVATGTSGIGELSPQGKLTVFTTNPMNGPWRYWGNVWGVTQDVDNRSLIFSGLSGNGPNTMVYVRWDPIAQSVTSILWSGPWLPPRQNGPPNPSSDLTLNPEGKVVGYYHGVGTNQIVEFDQQVGSMTTFAMPVTPTGWGWLGGVGGVEWDKICGGFYGANSRHWPHSTQQMLLRTSGDFLFSTVVAAVSTVSSPNMFASLGGTLLENGDWVSSSINPQFAYLEVKAGSGQWTAGPFLGRNSFQDVTAEKFAAPGRGYYASITELVPPSKATMDPRYHVAYVDATTTPHTISTLFTTAAANVVGGIQEVHPMFERDLCTRRTGTPPSRTWDILVNPDPTGVLGLAGKPYVLAASLAGAAPPILLPDGRQIFLVPDALTTLSLQGLLAPFLTNSFGILGSTPRATLNLNPFGRAVDGLRLHFCGVILDPRAPSGIAWVLDPWTLLVK